MRSDLAVVVELVVKLFLELRCIECDGLCHVPLCAFEQVRDLVLHYTCQRLENADAVDKCTSSRLYSQPQPFF